MKVFQAIFECDGLTVKAPGVSETSTRRESMLYAAKNVDAVLKHIKYKLRDPEKTFVSLAEIAPLIQVIGSPATTPEGTKT